MMGFQLSARSKANREGVDPRLIEISDMAILLTTVDFGHGELSGLRTAEQQNKLHLAGKSGADGYKILSNHQSGKALDFFAYVDGASWKHEHLAMVGAAFLQAASMRGYRVRWGGLWKSKKPKKKNGIVYGWDMPHIELID